MALIYVVDDAADYRFLIGRFLKHSLPEHTFAFFDDGASLCQETIESAHEQATRPDLVLMDIHMPGRNGIQTLICLKQVSGWNQIPVIMLSSSSDPAEIDACYQAGAQSVVNKATDWQAFTRHIQQLLAGESRETRQAGGA
ncbi:response regulator [Spirosoma sp. KUDC1026]|uniref:response regulator n=1 Tax=Spirosoma sp. KUDC1026 TaxID=2745947 RepID=UPI00159BB527|nr:response regulator [Spirosoma sp. KUDC1026]QKZ11792.1 response regulator [Spirosoma sp. KUDC1026]